MLHWTHPQWKSLSAATLIELLRQLPPETRVTANDVHNLALYTPDTAAEPDTYLGYIDFGDEQWHSAEEP